MDVIKLQDDRAMTGRAADVATAQQWAEALARQYMSSAVDTYKKAGVDPAGQRFRVWSFSADDEVKLRNSGSIASRRDGLLISSADLAALGIDYEVESIPLGDVATLAAWIFKQDQLGRGWTIPVWCSERATAPADRDTCLIKGGAL